MTPDEKIAASSTVGFPCGICKVPLLVEDKTVEICIQCVEQITDLQNQLSEALDREIETRKNGNELMGRMRGEIADLQRQLGEAQDIYKHIQKENDDLRILLALADRDRLRAGIEGLEQRFRREVKRGHAFSTSICCTCAFLLECADALKALLSPDRKEREK